MSAPWLADITHLTFDCYGTLIDWEQGILAAVQPLFDRCGTAVTPEAILQSYVAHEARLEAQGWKPYREILHDVMAGMAADFRLQVSGAELESLGESLPDWPRFPDTVVALQALSRQFQLVILSNTDDDLLAETQKRLQTDFVATITAEQVKSYKPGHAHFYEARRRLGVETNQILHVAQSLYHDHVPARELGFHTAWVNRPSRLAGTGLAPAATVQPNLTTPDLATLAAQLSARAIF